MKINVNFIIGMIGSGKTFIINKILNEEKYKKEKILIIQLEAGKQHIILSSKRQVYIAIDNSSFNLKLLKELIAKYLPNRIIVECNSMNGLEESINLFSNKLINKICSIEKSLCIIDSKTFNMYFMNFGKLFSDGIYYADEIILTNFKDIKSTKVKEITNKIKSINSYVKVSYSLYANILEKDEDKLFKVATSTLSIILLLIVFYICFKYSIYLKDLSILLNEFMFKFLGIILESIPFLLIGAFISSLFQVCISDTIIEKLMPKNKITGSILGSVIGILFPICDCGIIPLARGFIKRGIPLNAVISFILAAPIVNPLSIMSTYYAFPDNKVIVIYRVLIGVISSIFIGLIIGQDSKNVLTNDFANCNCASCSNIDLTNTSILGKLRNIFLLTKGEFFDISKFLIIGATIGSLIQMLFNNNLINNIPGGKLGTIIFMMLLGYCISICSTADAFVIRGLANSLPNYGILAFLVFGPMIDIKNTLVLSGSFNKKFIFKLIITTVIVVSCILMII